MIEKLAPSFLIAAPSLRDPNFKRAVILVVDHDEEGSLGFVVNREAPVTFGDVADELKLDCEQGLVEPAIFLGGPVAPQTGWIVFDPSVTNGEVAGAIVVAPRLGVSASRDVLDSIAQGKGPGRAMMFLGYAGWSAGQLDDEMREGTWIPVDFDANILFDTPPEERWSRALAQLGIDPGRLASVNATPGKLSSS